jgi:hypothetical protein
MKENTLKKLNNLKFNNNKVFNSKKKDLMNSEVLLKTLVFKHNKTSINLNLLENNMQILLKVDFINKEGKVLIILIKRKTNMKTLMLKKTLEPFLKCTKSVKKISMSKIK